MTDENMKSDNVSQETAATVEMPRQSLIDTPQQINNEVETVNTNSLNIPDDYKDAGWAKNIKTTEDLWKAHANAQTLIGKKTIGLPDENSTPEQIQDYYSKIRPKDLTEYEFAEGTSAEEKEFYSKIMYENGLTKSQAKSLSEAVYKQSAEAFSKKGMLEELEKSFGESDGDRARAASKFIASDMNEADKALLESIPNNILGLIYRFADTVKNKYGATEGTAVINNAGSMSAMNKEQMKAKIDSLYTDIINLGNRPHSEEERTKLINERSDLINKMRG